MLSLLRTRLYRFTSDRAAYVLVEALDERRLEGRPPLPETGRVLDDALREISDGREPVLDASALADLEHLQLGSLLGARESYEERERMLPAADIGEVLLIVGAPRSGTSHLLNLLAFQRTWAYLTNVSCWAWPTYNLNSTLRASFEGKGPGVFRRDSKELRLNGDLILPSEAEDLMSRAIPSYDHIRGHEYRLLEPRIADEALLTQALQAHARHFGRTRVVLKSPFSTFRLRQFARIFGASLRVIHIHRDGYEAAASIGENSFVYYTQEGLSTPAMGWAAHVHAALDAEPHIPILRVALEGVRRDAETELKRVFDWLELDAVPRLPAAGPPPRAVAQTAPPEEVIERAHARLGRAARVE